MHFSENDFDYLFIYRTLTIDTYQLFIFCIRVCKNHVDIFLIMFKVSLKIFNFTILTKISKNHCNNLTVSNSRNFRIVIFLYNPFAIHKFDKISIVSDV